MRYATRQQRWRYQPAAQIIMLAATCNHIISVVISVYANRGDREMAIDSKEYDRLCELTDELREAQQALFVAASTNDSMDAARRFVAAENAWEDFVNGLVDSK
ncbi:hypothetical protein [Salmonella phage PhiSTP1]|nr:hypothetical protein [Salmonella phage PhiSTP1]